MRTIISALALLSLSACGETAKDNPQAASITKPAKGVEITLKSVEVSHDVGPAGLVPTAPAGATYVHISYGLKNKAREALSWDKWPQPRLVDPSGQELKPETFASTALSAAENAGWAETLNPNLGTEAQLVWKIDEKSFDRATWKLVFLTKPKTEFELK